MKTPTCSDVHDSIDEYIRQELAASDAKMVTGHLERCESCRLEAESARNGLPMLEILRDDGIIAGVDEARLRIMRSRILAHVRDQAAPAQRFGLGWGWALAASALLLAAVLPHGMVSPDPDARLSAGVPEIHLRTIGSLGGATTLSWDGAAGTYQVTRTAIGKGYRLVETAVVCGKTWTDRSRPAAAIYYEVAPTTESCRG